MTQPDPCTYDLDPCPEIDPWPDLGPYPDPHIDPYPDRTVTPYTDDATAALLDDIVTSLIIIRGGATLDPGSRISVLTSLQTQASDRIPKAVWIARVHHGYTWPQIAQRLATTTDTARRRYNTHRPTPTGLKAPPATP